MSITEGLRTTLVFGAMWQLLLPSALLAEVPERVEIRVVDLQLDAGRVLPGQYVDGQGRPLRGAQVQLRSGQNLVGVTTTDDQGRFRFAEVKGGVYHVGTADSLAVCRAWAPRTAPPQAHGSILLVSGVDVTRGQRPFAEVITNPLVIAAAVAAAIAIPIAIHNSGDDTNGS